MANTPEKTRYSDQELQEFREHIEKKLNATQEQYDRLMLQIQETSENGSDEHGGDWVDDSGYNSDIEMLQTMAIRQKKYLEDLKAALFRIRNKVYGICVNTGSLIDKKRLMAVPTTTKSLAAKGLEQAEAMKASKEQRSKLPYIKKERKIISKVIKKSGGSPIPSSKKAMSDYDEDIDDPAFDDTNDSSEEIDMNEIVDESSYED